MPSIQVKVLAVVLVVVIPQERLLRKQTERERQQEEHYACWAIASVYCVHGSTEER